jgi:uncharacterized cupredoxin-like copper-binding protein
LNAPVLVAALSTGNKIGLAVAAAIFIAFSLWSSFIAPRRWPDFPGRALNVFIVVSVALFGMMLAAVEVFAVEEEEAEASEGTPEAGGSEKRIMVGETEYRIELPPTATKLAAGTYDFHVVNDGKQVHNFVVDGPGVEDETTPNLQPGKEADLRVKLTNGTYDVYCSIDGHRQLGMEARLTIG